MNTVATMGLLAKLPAEASTAAAPPSAEDTRAATLAKKAAQARARREKKKGSASPAPAAKPAKPAAPAKTAPKAKPAPVAKPKPAPAAKKAAKPKVEKVNAGKTAKAKGKTGGAREGAGRKSIYAGQIMRTISFKGTEAQHAEFLAAGGGNWARAGLDERLAFKAKKGGKQ